MVRTRELDIANGDCARKRVPNRNAGIKRHAVMGGPDGKGNGDSMVTILAMRSMTGYAPGLIATVTALFLRDDCRQFRCRLDFGSDDRRATM